MWVDVSRSSWLEAARYLPSVQVMRIKTKAGIEYEVQGVSQATWDAFVDASSRGRFLHRVLFPQHPDKRVV